MKPTSRVFAFLCLADGRKPMKSYPGGIFNLYTQLLFRASTSVSTMTKRHTRQHFVSVEGGINT